MAAAVLSRSRFSAGNHPTLLTLVTLLTLLTLLKTHDILLQPCNTSVTLLFLVGNHPTLLTLKSLLTMLALLTNATQSLPICSNNQNVPNIRNIAHMLTPLPPLGLMCMVNQYLLFLPTSPPLFQG
jgi:hypothetical protein